MSMGNGSTKYPSQLKSYWKGENKNKTNWNTKVAIYINMYYWYVFLYDKQQIVMILSNFQTNYFRTDLPKSDGHG